MARRSVLAAVTAILLVSGCISVEPGAETATPGETLAPPATGTAQPSTTLPTAPAPTPTEEPERTLAPGETPQPTPLDITSLLTATLTVLNLTDESVSATVDLFSDGEEQGTVAQLDIEPYGSLFQSVIEATYQISIVRGAAEPITCLVTLASGQEVSFALIGTDITVTDPAVPPTDAEDILIATSPLCEPAP